ncbi:tRNA (adenosine(37)-N6)-dimethylallyltransferase MiaA [Carboxylicivirga sediminis]|uniref:tRNA dimethylallyltransferase n=1 Tax=Carboxylicivirga sediminis TaxID=2006564 RepID=A0A941F0D9_9BACT|nr:tRNA (adenosine(37)-N6)-dimethylallyltransferase MiaA [Carboxylicivirga sediminis]MBR8534242.1 tRNA (adenosine(37)-N6)-dimethylallyltransferase MiaA [Carboxylicivirga sediminis]
MTHSLIVLIGPTGIGKTELCLQLAEHLNTEIISSDSRQIFKELKIGTAAPTEEQLKRVKHHMVATHSVNDYYNAYQFEQDVLKLLDNLFQSHPQVLMTGGSMMYVDAVCKGIDELPTIDPELRQEVMDLYNNEGLEAIRRQLKMLDPVFYDQVDLKNHKRVMHAVEVCLMTGQPYSSLRTNSSRKRPFNIIKIGLDMDRDELYSRINQRVDMMIEDGLFEEAKAFYHLKESNSLNTVGYKEIFAHWDGEYDADKAIELIKRNSRRYAKRQLSWFRRDKEINWFHPSQVAEIIKFVDKQIELV